MVDMKELVLDGHKLARYKKRREIEIQKRVSLKQGFSNF